MFSCSSRVERRTASSLLPQRRSFPSSFKSTQSIYIVINRLESTMAPVRHDAAPSPPSPKKSHVPTTNGATPPAGHGLLHRLSMLILLPLLTMWDSLVFFFDRVFATILYWLGLQVRLVSSPDLASDSEDQKLIAFTVERFRVDKPAPGHHPIVVATGTSTGDSSSLLPRLSLISN